MTAPRPTSTPVGPPRGRGPAWERPGARPTARDERFDALLAWYFVIVWGSGYLASKDGLQYAPPFTFLSLRFAFGIVCVAPCCCCRARAGRPTGASCSTSASPGC